VEFDENDLSKASNLDMYVDRIAEALYRKMSTYAECDAWVLCTGGVEPKPEGYQRACKELGLFSNVERIEGRDIISMNWAGFQDFYVK